MNYLRYVRIIGTMHVSPKSREEVVQAILKEHPIAIAVELDQLRFQGLIEGRKASFGESLQMGRAGIMGYLLTKLEEKLGEEIGMAPGGEMLQAINLARKLGLPIFLIDEDIRVILGKIVRAPMREKLMLALEGLSFFAPNLRRGENMSEREIIESYLDMMREFKTRYPYLFRVLVEERNGIMATSLMMAVDTLKAQGVKRPKIIAVVGLGHKKGIEKILNSGRLRSKFPSPLLSF